ncbi:NAD(P)/FAD-dependent oxidoreductase [Nocardioides ungokensis]|uniref:NAD(P)/FAD-dependent oxidoreductase n=1 Tax=Nocardioides ungokensis TaxID=1643322 RepID=UPI0015DF6F99|nr:FAD-dependent oxidoreductase [Nocardioides ungokensis]
MTDRIVVVGGGLAAGTAVVELRERGFDGEITLLADEAHPPYERPPLSKSVLLGEKDAGSAILKEPAWYADHAVDLRTGTHVESLDLDGHRVLAAGESIPYDRLLLATGARPRRLALADESGASVGYLRTMDDSVDLRRRFRDGFRLGVVGGGWIGLEAAAAARTSGAEVTVLESLDLPLLRVLGPEVAGVMAELHREHGVDLRTGAEITGIKRDGDEVQVSLADGSTLTVDHLLVGVGVQPNTEIAEAAGLIVDNGIRVDRHLRTSREDVFAAGDVANADHPVLGTSLRVEHWDTAIQHGKVAAANLMGGHTDADALPYFFTDQYDFGMEYVGHATPGGYDQVVLRGDVQGRVFTAWWLDGTRVVAGMHANDWDAIDDVRRLVGRQVDPARLADDGTALAEVITG